MKTLSFHTGALENLYRRDNTGEIEPFVANDSITINAGRWPPIYEGVSGLLYLVGEVETLPVARLQGRVRFKNDLGGFWSVNFDMRDYPIVIYRINFPPTVWAGYGFSLVIVALVSVNFIYKRKRGKH